MAKRRGSGDRIEPSFNDRDEDDESADDFRLSAEDRVVGSSGRNRKPKREQARIAQRREPGPYDDEDVEEDAYEEPRRPVRRAERRAPAKPEPKAKRGSARSGKTKERRGGLFGAVRFVLYWSLVLGLWAIIAIGGLVLYYGSRMPSADSWKIPDRPPNVKIVDVSGAVVANRGATGGEELSLQDMSPFLPQAIIAIEDRRFYSHFGIDPLGLGRAIVTNIISRHAIQGGSTLTQQLAKNLFLSPDRTLERKVQEVLLALWLEHKFTKDQILTMYLNRVYFGSNAYGVEAAARRYFNKSARDVNLMEAATIAGLVKAPTRLSPARDPAAAEARAQVVLKTMREEGFITDRQATSALAEAPTKAAQYWTGAGNYVADMVMDELPKLVGDIKDDLIVETTLDGGLEKEAEKALAKTLDQQGGKYNVTQGALVSIDGTGAIRALVGGRNYAESQFNRAVKAKRQPGSAFKPFVYATALDMGNSPYSERNDAPVKIGNWTPENFDQKYRGPIRLIDAITESVNTIAAQLVMEAGPDQVIKTAHRMGIESDLQANASIALGTSEVSLMELTGAYAAFMNGGFKATPHVIRKVSTPDGKLLYQAPEDQPLRVLPEAVVINMNAMLTSVVRNGTGKAARLDGWQVAGKTGTTQSFRDALFVGFTSNLTTGVWVGNDDGTPMKKVTGGMLPAAIWHSYMLSAHKGLTPTPLFGNGMIVDAPLPNPDVTPLDPALTAKIENELAQANGGAAPPAKASPAQPATQPGTQQGLQTANAQGTQQTVQQVIQQADQPAQPQQPARQPLNAAQKAALAKGRPVVVGRVAQDDAPELIGPVSGNDQDLIPPADVGRPSGYRPRETTLLDILLGN